MDHRWMSIRHHLKLFILLSGLLFSQLTLADIIIDDAYILAGPPTATAHAAYFSISNNNHQAIILCHVNSTQFGAIEIHRTVLTRETFSMEHLESITIPPSSTTRLEPGGIHLMLFRPHTPLKRGTTIQMELVFEQAESITVSFPVRTPADM